MNKIAIILGLFFVTSSLVSHADDWQVKRAQPKVARKRLTAEQRFERNFALFLSYLNSEKLKKAEVLIKNGFDLNSKNKKGFTPLVEMIFKQNDKAVEFLLAHGADPNVEDLSHTTALFHVAFLKKDRPDYARLLIDHKADYNKMNCSGWSPLHQAINANNEEVAMAILDQKDVDLSARHYTPLQCYTPKDPGVAIYLANQVNIAESPLVIAAAMGSQRLVHRILQLNPNLTEKSGAFNQTPLMAAAASCVASNVGMILNYALSNLSSNDFQWMISMHDENGFTAAMLAARFCCVTKDLTLETLKPYPEAFRSHRKLQSPVRRSSRGLKLQAPYYEFGPLAVAQEYEKACPDNLIFLHSIQSE